MKYFYTFLSIVMVSLAAISASAQDTVTFTIDFDDPSAVTVTRDYSTKIEVTQGVNTFTLPLWTSFSVKANPGYSFESVTNSAGTPQSIYSGMWSLYVSNTELNGQAYIVKTVDLEKVRTASFTLTVDDPTMVSASLSGTGQNLSISENTTVFKFAPELEQTLYVASYGSKPLYKVTLDGVEVPVNGFSVEVPLHDGAVVEATSKYPDLPAVITFDYDAEAFPDLLTGASVNYTSVTDFDGKTMTVQAGDNVSVFTNGNYKIDAITIDGVPYNMDYYYGSFNFSPRGDCNIKIEAHPYGNMTVIVNIDDPEALTLYAGQQNDDNIQTLNPGRNEVLVPENEAVISWKVNNGYEITSVTSSTGGDIYYTSVSTTDGMELTFATSKIVLDKQFVFWIDDKAAAQYYFRLSDSKRQEYPVVNGYNTFGFTDSFNPFEITWAGGAAAGWVYVNDIEVAPMYEGGTYWNVTVGDNDVVKAFVGGPATKCDVTFTVDGDKDAIVTRDLLNEVADWRQGFSCFAGTTVRVVPSDECEAPVAKVNGEELVPGEDGAFEFTVADPATAVELKLDAKEGITAIESDNDATDVYNLQGIKVGSTDSLGTLPSGLYITAGKKIYVK